MAGKIKHLLERDGRFYSRLVVPTALREYLGGRTELRTPLGADRKAAERSHHGALADLYLAIRQAEQIAEIRGHKVPERLRHSLTTEQLVALNYHQRLAQDELARQTTLTSLVPVDTDFAAELRAGMAGKLNDAALAELVGHRIDGSIALGLTEARSGSQAWRTLAIALCASEYEALERVYERDNGVFDGQPKHPMVADALKAAALRDDVEPSPVSLIGLFDDYIAAKKIIGKGAEAARRWSPVFKHLTKQLGHDNANRLTKKDLLSWRNGLLNQLSPKTVSDVYLASVRTVLNWAVREDRLAKNVAEDVRQEVPRTNLDRERGFTVDEAKAILVAATSYRSRENLGFATREFDETASAKRWVPILCAHTGARVGEMAQLRSQDLRLEGGCWVLRITPEAGTVKAGGFRDVPLHPQLVELGFIDFVEGIKSGPLFYRSKTPQGNLKSAQTVSGRLSEWLGTTGLIPDGVAPNHGWRHRFKTVGRDLGVSDRVLDAICGHAGRTAGDNYGDVTIHAKKQLIDRMPAYDLSAGISSGR